MTYTIVGLGNPGEDYEGTRHNVGRALVMQFAHAEGFPAWEEEKKKQTLVTEGKIGKEKVVVLLPNTFMNKSGKAVAHYVKSKKAIEQLVVVYDDIDLPLGSIRIAFGRGSGGHRGVESIIKTLKTKDFTRVRVGVSAITPSGTLKKPKGEQAVIDFLMKAFRKPEQTKLKHLSKSVTAALHTLIQDGRPVAMNQFN